MFDRARAAVAAFFVRPDVGAVVTDATGLAHDAVTLAEDVAGEVAAPVVRTIHDVIAELERATSEMGAKVEASKAAAAAVTAHRDLIASLEAEFNGASQAVSQAVQAAKALV
jgi:uncharacterized protein YoxC